MNMISNEAAPENPILIKIKRFIEAAILVNPELKDRLNIAACIQYLDLPDATYGWDATNFKTPGSMPIEYKIACLMPTITNGLPPGSIIWLGNKPYATAAAISFEANRSFRALSGITFRAFTPEEKSMFGIGDKDMAVVAQRTVSVGNVELFLEGYGVLGWDESQPNSKNNYKVATEKTRDRMQFVRTRAIRDMYNRHISIGGIPSEDDYYPDPMQANPVPEAQPVIEQTPWAKPDPAEVDKALELKFSDLFVKIKQMGGDADAIVGDESISVPVSIKLMELWIENNKPPEPEPPKGKRTRRTKEQIEADEKAKAIAEVPKTDRMGLPIKEPSFVITHQGAVDIQEIEISPMNQMADTVSPEEIESIVNEEPHLEYDIPEEDIDPMYEGTEEQKDEIRKAVKEGGLPEGNGILHALSAAMKGQPMSKLPIKIKALKSTVKATDIPKAVPPSSTLQEQRDRFIEIAEKVMKAGGKTMNILEGKAPFALAKDGTSEEILAGTKKLWDWYERFVNS